jgi:putative heme iron utilization protein
MSSPQPLHDAPPELLAPPPPLEAGRPARRRSPAEEARTLVATSSLGTLATLSDDGHPWGSLVAYGTLDDGSPVLCVSVLAEHGRNLLRDPRASLVVAEATTGADPLDGGRVTLAGRVEPPAADALVAARAAHLAAVPAAQAYIDFGDFSLWRLCVERVRWVGGYGRMDTVDADEYARAAPDPVASSAAGAIAHLNADHADALLAMARALAGYTDASAAVCRRIDRYGLDLAVRTPRGAAPARITFEEPVDAPGGLREATVRLARLARG